MLPAGDLINVQGKEWPKDASCYLGHTGPMCKLCIENWALNDLTGECTDCGSGGNSSEQVGRIAMWVVIALLVVLVVLAFKYREKLNEYFRKNLGFLLAIKKMLVKYRVKAKVMLTFMQITSQYVGSCLNPPWPSFYAGFARKLGVVNLNFPALAGASCAYKFNFIAYLWISTVLPILMAFLLLLFRTYLMATMPTKTKDDRQQRFDVDHLLALAFFALTYMVFPSVSVTIFRTFQCDYDISDTDGYDNPDRRLGYMRADYSIPCRGYGRLTNNPSNDFTDLGYDRLFGWEEPSRNVEAYVSGIDTYNAARVYAILMMLIYPIGIPLMYFVSTYRSKHLIDPDPLVVLSDVVIAVSPDEESVKFEEGEERKAGRDGHLDITDDSPTSTALRHLTHQALRLIDAEQRLIAQAVEVHAERLAEQAKKDYQKSRAFAQRHGTDGATPLRRMSIKAHEKLAIVKRQFDEDRVADSWQEELPGYAAALDVIKEAEALIEGTLIEEYRASDARVSHLAFLFEAYEPRCWYFETIECLRRLMLTGLLVVIPDEGNSLNIVIAALIAIFYLVVYGGIKPFIDEHVDAFATFAQLMTFLQLFLALLLATGVIEGWPNSLVNASALGCNLGVIAYAALGFLVMEATEEDAGDLADSDMSVSLCGCCLLAHHTKKPKRPQRSTADMELLRGVVERHRRVASDERGDVQKELLKLYTTEEGLLELGSPGAERLPGDIVSPGGRHFARPRRGRDADDDDDAAEEKYHRDEDVRVWLESADAFEIPVRLVGESDSDESTDDFELGLDPNADPEVGDAVGFDFVNDDDAAAIGVVAATGAVPGDELGAAISATPPGAYEFADDGDAAVISATAAAPPASFDEGASPNLDDRSPFADDADAAVVGVAAATELDGYGTGANLSADPRAFADDRDADSAGAGVAAATDLDGYGADVNLGADSRAFAGDTDAAIEASNTDAEPGDFDGSVGPVPGPAVVPLEARPIPEHHEAMLLF